ncbi:MAG: 4-(cytidine 5'-diphospho)-2-C-methyl-D-erythritol kinase [Sphingobium sp.]|uniref:4-(cytidine 5'-diphospho)-2-C-methyl-D-erythritol kinase n=1 Tax=Sphingobium sp. TaxID=1912891 RepID=UPI0029A64A2D|nr:4-(cytidine 5'-diphospho)-2-C-methyl-D-erythritol kinase [Sphingobium sp.]MDX3908504.1 4-(cytidine 5'-diphospho)-2-C-methyl-D-erythritol kinase [Sphingobium sp.]
MTEEITDAEIAHAKINLALHVRLRRRDGYHDIESLFAFAEDGDRLVATSRADGAVNLTIDGPFGDGLDTGPHNLVLRAAMALKEQSESRAGADIRLTKNLPVASGIGGGSADAAATLRLLGRLWHSEADLVSIAARLGSDVPACLMSRTLVGTGRGEALDLRDIPQLPGAPLLLVNPGVGLSTAAVFGGWDGVDRGALDASDLSTISRLGRNDLYPSAAEFVPVIKEVLKRLSEQPGVQLARMSGSGATCFALFDSISTRDCAAAAMSADWWVLPTRIRTS